MNVGRDEILQLTHGLHTTLRRNATKPNKKLPQILINPETGKSGGICPVSELGPPSFTSWPAHSCGFPELYQTDRMNFS